MNSATSCVRSAVGATGRSPLRSGPPKRSLGAFAGGLKSAVVKRINDLRGTPGIPIWQRNYYEHVIRDEESLHRIRQYVVDNPARWAFDPENPGATSPETGEPWRPPLSLTFLPLSPKSSQLTCLAKKENRRRK